MTIQPKGYKTYRVVSSGECPYDLDDVDDLRPECAFHVHLKLELITD